MQRDQVRDDDQTVWTAKSYLKCTDCGDEWKPGGDPAIALLAIILCRMVLEYTVI